MPETRSPHRPLLTGLLAALAGAGVFFSLWSPVPSPDGWMHLALGRELFARGFSMLHQDTFSYLPARNPWVSNEWLTYAVLYGLREGLGPWSLPALKYLLGFGTALFLFLAAGKRGAGAASRFLVLILASYFFTLVFPMVKAQDFTWLFFAMTLWWLEWNPDVRTPWGLLGFAPVFALWANFHAGFVSGLGIVFLYALARAAKGKNPLPHVALLAAGALLALANPYGHGLYLAVVRHAGISPQSVEWRSILSALRHPDLARFGILYLLFAAIAASLGRKRVLAEPGAWLVLAVTFLLGVRHIRHLPFFVLAMAVYVPAWIEAAFSPGPGGQTFLSALKKRPVAAFLVAAALLFNLFLVASQAAFTRTLGGPFTFRAFLAREVPFGISYCPVEAVDFLEKNRIKGNLLAEPPWPGYVNWRLHGQVKTGVDNRSDAAFPGEIVEKDARFFRMEPGWQSFLDDFPHQILLLRDNTPLFSAMETRPGWTLVFHVPGSAVFLRDGAAKGSFYNL